MAPSPPLRELYDLLRAEGLAIGVDDHIRIGRLLACEAIWTLDTLRASIAALVATDPQELRAFDTCWEHWLRSAEQVHLPDVMLPAPQPPPRRRARRLATRLGALAAIVAVVLTGRAIIGDLIRTPGGPAGANIDGGEGAPALDAGVVSLDDAPARPNAGGNDAAVDAPALPPGGAPDTHADAGIDAPAAVTGSAPLSFPPPRRPPPPSHTVLDLACMALILGALVLVVAALGGTLAARARRRFLPGPWRYALAVPPATRPVLPRTAVEDAAADLTGRVHAGSSELDIPRTVTATVARGGLPTLVHRRSWVAPRYLVLQDTAAGADRWSFLYDELLRGLAREGVALERYTFVANPAHCTAGDGRAVALADLLDHVDAMIAIGDGEAAVDPLSGARAPWLASLHQVPQRLWINPQPRARWGPGARAIATDTPMHHGVARAMAAIHDSAAGRSFRDRACPAVIERAPGTASAIAALRTALGERAFQLVAAAAIAGPPTMAAARWLAQVHSLALDEHDWLAVASLPWFRTGQWPAGLRERLCDALASDAPALVYALEATSDRLVALSEPPSGSGAHLAWQLDGAVRAAQRGDRASAARALSQIARTPLAHQARDALGELRIPDRRRRTWITALTVGAAFVIGGAAAVFIALRLDAAAIERRAAERHLEKLAGDGATLVRPADDRLALGRMSPPGDASAVRTQTMPGGPKRTPDADLAVPRASPAGDGATRLHAADDSPPEAFAVRVVDGNGDPVAGAHVVWSNPQLGPGSHIATTDAAGLSRATQVYSSPPRGALQQVAQYIATWAGPPFVDGPVPADGDKVVFRFAQVAEAHDCATADQAHAPLQHHDRVMSAAFSPDGSRVVTASVDRTARIWSAATGKPCSAPLQHKNLVATAAFSPDGSRVVTASWDRTARVWDAASGAPVTGPLEHQDRVMSAVFSPDGRRVVTASFDNTARVWDAATGTLLSGPFQHRDAVMSAVFSPDGRRVVTASLDKTARVWDATTGKPLSPALRHQGAVTSAVFSPDGARIITASSDKTARVWDAATGKPVVLPIEDQGIVETAAFSPDATRIITASSDKTARIWDAATGKPLSLPLQHEGIVETAAFSPDGTRVVTASWDKTVRIWDAATGKPLVPPLQHRGAVASAVFSADGTRIITASSDKTARIWDAATGALLVPALPDQDPGSSEQTPGGPEPLPGELPSPRVSELVPSRGRGGTQVTIIASGIEPYDVKVYFGAREAELDPKRAPRGLRVTAPWQPSGVGAVDVRLVLSPRASGDRRDVRAQQLTLPNAFSYEPATSAALKQLESLLTAGDFTAAAGLAGKLPSEQKTAAANVALEAYDRLADHVSYDVKRGACATATASLVQLEAGVELLAALGRDTRTAMSRIDDARAAVERCGAPPRPRPPAIGAGSGSAAGSGEIESGAEGGSSDAPPPPRPRIGTIVETRVQGSTTIITVILGTTIDKGSQATVLRGDSDQPLRDGDVQLIRIDKGRAVGRVKLTLDQLSQNRRVRFTPPGVDPLAAGASSASIDAAGPSVTPPVTSSNDHPPVTSSNDPPPVAPQSTDIAIQIVRDPSDKNRETATIVGDALRRAATRTAGFVVVDTGGDFAVEGHATIEIKAIGSETAPSSGKGVPRSELQDAPPRGEPTPNLRSRVTCSVSILMKTLPSATTFATANRGASQLAADPAQIKLVVKACLETASEDAMMNQVLPALRRKRGAPTTPRDQSTK